MTLFEWLKKENKTDSWLADQLGFSRAAVSGYRTGKTQPSLDTAIHIHILTNNEVGYEEMLGKAYARSNSDLETL
jgi:transcriptional regulator with XRE-family HTH domain